MLGVGIRATERVAVPGERRHRGPAEPHPRPRLRHQHRVPHAEADPRRARRRRGHHHHARAPPPALEDGRVRVQHDVPDAGLRQAVAIDAVRRERGGDADPARVPRGARDDALVVPREQARVVGRRERAGRHADRAATVVMTAEQRAVGVVDVWRRGRVVRVLVVRVVVVEGRDGVRSSGRHQHACDHEGPRQHARRMRGRVAIVERGDRAGGGVFFRTRGARDESVAAGC